ncbi:hypothetical protein NDU88_007351 [Pleurodeles waltl]|uniref:Uncharacterized protein n=1 Tax=Pleurodeles waltl TaxID=8319 RepID=A0AAV7PPN0_PLEWA|nr:hypothetical protein NDU88_007351 [Pleurodeles waltl]
MFGDVERTSCLRYIATEIGALTDFKRMDEAACRSLFLVLPASAGLSPCTVVPDVSVPPLACAYHCAL